MPELTVEKFSDTRLEPAVRGFLHSPDIANGVALILTHGAGSNSNSPMLVALAETFCGHGYAVLLCDLPFRQAKSFGPPSPATAECDRAGLKNAVAAMRAVAQVRAPVLGAHLGDKTISEESSGKIFLGGHSYGGRQSTMLCASEPDLVAGLLLLSYPLHPPRKPEQLRTQHLPNLRTPCLFVHGTRDPFGSIDEMKRALQLIPAKNELIEIDGAGHDLGFKGKERAPTLPVDIFSKFEEVFG